MLPRVIRLSSTGKMPCESYSLPAENCVTGSKLRKVEGSVCADCYARKGRYRMQNVREPRDWNLYVWRMAVADGSIFDWVDAMVKAIGAAPYFRWFDSGDVQGSVMFRAICLVAKRTPATKHWLPTKERATATKLAGIIPPNLRVRISSPMVGQLQEVEGFVTSTVGGSGWTCPAPQQGGKCLDCRACWTKRKNINYERH